MNWLSQCAFHGPAAMQATEQDGARHTLGLRPVNGAHGYAIQREQSLGPRVSGLSLPVGPRAVAGGVRAVVVRALERVVRAWAWTHVGKEATEIGSPFVRHSDSATAVIGKVSVVRLIAARLGVIPGVVLGALLSARRKAMSLAAARVLASAPARIVVRQPVGWPHALGAAIATTQPMGRTPLGGTPDHPNNKPATESLAGQIFHARMHAPIVPQNIPAGGYN